MNVKFLSFACLLMLGTTAGLAERPAGTRPSVTYDPNEPEKTRTMIPREEREKLGLTPRSWTGVVHPDVYARLDGLKQTVASLKDRVNKKDERAFQALSAIRFEGTVYVQVQVKADPSIMDGQRAVLRSLKASEFYVQQLFDGAAGFVGYATKEGLDKLAKHPGVLGVCLDDKPLPEKGQTIFKDHLPPATPGDTAPGQPGVKEGKVDPDVYRAFDLADRVDVSISLRKDSLPKLTDVPSEMRARYELRRQAERQLHDRVLSTVNADDFWLSVGLGSVISGYVTKDGLGQLWKHPDVQRVVLRQLSRIPEHNLRSR